MAASRAYRHQHLAPAPRGWRVRSRRAGEHLLRIAFPPGARRRGSGRVLEILHPKRNPSCQEGSCELCRKNPEELLIFGNPSKLQLQRQARDRAKAIRGARGNPLSKLYDIWEITPSDQTRRMYQGLTRGEARKRLAELRQRTEGSGWRYIMKRPQESNPGWLDPKDKLWGHFAVAGGSADSTEFRSAREARVHAKRLAKETGKSVHYRGPKNKPYTVRNPLQRNAGGIGNHKPNCKCPFCRRARATNPRQESSQQRRRRGHAMSRRRRNQGDEPLRQAVSLYGTFHGRDPEEIAEKQESAAMRLEYTALGDIEYLIVKPEDKSAVKINFEGDGVKLASAPNGRQLYLIGGNQNLSSMLDKFTDDPEKDFIDLGEGLEAQYDARKIHSNFAPTSWYHKFGEKNGALPRLMYDKLKKRIFFVGGEYFIDTRDAVSPGIEN